MLQRRSGRRPLASIILLALALLLIAGPLAAAPVAAQADDALPGDWSVFVTPADALDDVPNSDMMVGVWRLSFGEDGAYAAERNDLGVLVRGTWERSGDEVIVTDESGILSCSEAGNAEGAVADAATGTYRLVEDDDSLRFEVVGDACGLRKILFTASSLTPFVPCPVVSTGLAALEGEGKTVYEPSAQATEGSVEQQIDRFLAELTACWATGDPERFLPLLTEDYRPIFVSAGTDEGAEDPSEQARALSSAMGIEFTFTRAGSVREVREGEATCIVRTVIGGQESLSRFRFVFTDGAWYWDGPA
jgi:hypothetical protein